MTTAGYNVSTELIAHAHRAVLIPRILHRQEQLIRARRLEELGLVTCLHPDDVTPQRLFDVVQHALASDTKPLAESRARRDIPLDGAVRFAELCASIVEARVTT